MLASTARAVLVPVLAAAATLSGAAPAGAAPAPAAFSFRVASDISQTIVVTRDNETRQGPWSSPHASQLWHLDQMTTDTFEIRLIYNRACLQADGIDKLDPIVVAPCRDADAEQWQIESAGGAYRLRNPVSDLCANVEGGSGSGHRLILWTCADLKNEYWLPVWEITRDNEPAAAGEVQR